jgi:bla regulator protein BlaR1
MIPSYLFLLGSISASAVGNHLWQSTLFASIAGLLMLALQKNQARVRCWIWFAASVKFLLPFSWLIAIGSHMAQPRAFPVVRPTVFFALDKISQPFMQPTTSVSASTASANLLNATQLIPWILLTVWLCGLISVLLVWCLRWWRISSALLAALPLREGREVEALQRMERVEGTRIRMKMLLSPTSVEPGIFGIVRPVLVWPKGIAERLEDAQLEAILAHEICHARSYDNLTAAIHMLVEAIFWFHPLVWWLGTRLVEERERACDEEVLQLCKEPRIYAESILKVCQFCVESPMVCISGVTGSDLKKRIVRIMTEAEHVAGKLDFLRKFLLYAAGLAVIAVPIAFGQVRACQAQARSLAKANPGNMPSEVFDVASIKPNSPKGGHFMFGGGWSSDGFTSFGTTLHTLAETAYGVQDSQILGGPSWVDSERYDVQAKMSSSVADALQKLSPDQQEVVQEHMLQALLADRFHLVIRHENKELPIYALVITKNGPKLKEADPANTYANGFKAPDGSPAGSSVMEFGGGQLTGQGVPVSVLVLELSQQPELAGRTLIDRTGLARKYDFTLQWSPQRSASNSTLGFNSGPGAESSGASLFTALREQLGLAVESTKGLVDTIVIDHAERVSEN